MTRLVGVLALLAATPCLGQSLNQEVTQETLADTVCSPGYANAMRPSFWESQKTKLRMLTAAGETWAAAPVYRLDHVVPICLGGHPSASDNLQLQRWTDAQLKDRIEAKLCCLVCTGQVTLQTAQGAIMTDWRAAYHTYATTKCRRAK